MAHLAQHAAVRGADALDGPVGAVRVERHLRRRDAVLVAVLRDDLAVVHQAAQLALAADEAALAVGDGDLVDIADVHARHPRGLDGGDDRAHMRGGMAADGVVGQRRIALVERADLAVRHQAQLDERLEAVADAQHQAVPLIQQRVDRVHDARIAQRGRDELAGAVRLVACGEAARQHDDLRVLDAPDNRLDGLLDALGRQVAEDEGFHLGARAAEGLRAVQLAVGTREGRDEHARLCDVNRGPVGVACDERLVRRNGMLGRRARREDALQRRGPGLVRLLQGEHRAQGVDHRMPGREADDLHARRHRRAVRQLADDAAVSRQEELLLGHAVQAHAYAAAQRHHRDGSGDAAAAHSVRRKYVAALDRLAQQIIAHERLVVFRQEVAVHRQAQQRDAVVAALEIGGDDVLRLHGSHRKGDERRRDMDVLKRAAHGVLAADGRGAEAQLRGQAAQQRGRRLAPALLVLAQLLKVLLEGQAGLRHVAARRTDLGQGLGDRVHRAVERAPLAQVRIIAVGHQRRGGRLTLGRDQRGHRLVRAVAVHAAVRRQDRTCADGAVKALDHALLGADVQVAQHGQPRFAHGLTLGKVRLRGQVRVLAVRRGDHRARVLRDAVGVQERAGQIDDRLAAPVHHQALLLGDDRNLRRLQVLLIGHLLEALDHVRLDHAGHALLGLGDRQLGAVQALILLGHGVQLDDKARGQLAHGDAHAARAEVVAALDHLRKLRAAEQALDAALGRRVALLDLRAAGGEGLDAVRLGGAGCAAAAVAAGAAAQQHDHVARGRLAAADMVARGRRDDGAQLHALGDEARMVVFLHLARGQADLVTVGGVALRGGRGDAALRELALAGAGVGHARIAGAGDAHRLINIAAAGERVADGAAQAGGRAAEALDLGGMVVRLVLEHDQPGLFPAVHVRGDDDGARVDLVGRVQVVELADLPKRLRAQGRHVHQGHVLFALAVHVPAGVDVQLVRRADRLGQFAALKFKIVNRSQEGGVAAVIGPIGVDGAQLRDGRVALLGVAEVIAAEAQILRAHRHAHGLHHVGKRLVAHGGEAFDDGHIRRDVGVHRQGFGLVHAGAARLNRVDEVRGNRVHHRPRHLRALDGIHLRADHLRSILIGAEQLQALAGAVGALVILARQVLHRQQLRVHLRQRLIVQKVNVRLGEDDALRALKRRLGNALHVVALEDAHALDRLRAQHLAQLAAQLLRGDVIARTLLCIDSSDLTHDNPPP